MVISYLYCFSSLLPRMDTCSFSLLYLVIVFSVVFPLPEPFNQLSCCCFYPCSSMGPTTRLERLNTVTVVLQAKLESLMSSIYLGGCVKLRRPSLTVGGKDHDHRELVHDESERPQLASGNSLLSMNRQTEHGYKRPTLVAPLDKKGHAHF